jgi:catalase
MWLMSDRALPRSYRMMQGFGVHTFRLVNASGRGTFVKFHWKPQLGTHSLMWDEAQKIAGKDPDFNRRDLWDAIEAGDYPQWELGVQLVSEADEFAFDFDLLDATKFIPEEQVPVQPVGKLVLNRNPDNFFAETEQVAFHTANVVPGIDFTNDPLLQFRNFSYLDTQLIRLGGPNFAQLPVNRPVADVRTNQQDGYGQHVVPVGRSSYTKNTLGGGCPALAGENVFRHYTEHIDGRKMRRRAKQFENHYSQARMFWRSMSAVEAEHIVAAYAFELGKVETLAVRAAVVIQLSRVDGNLAARVAAKLGMPEPEAVPVDDTPVSAALSLLNSAADTIATRKIAVLAADGVDVAGTQLFIDGLRERGAIAEVLAPVGGGGLAGGDGGELSVDRALTTMASVLYDGVVVPCGPEAVATLAQDGYALHFIAEAYKHLKPIAAFGAGLDLLRAAGIPRQLASDNTVLNDQAVVTTTAAGTSLPTEVIDQFSTALAGHRCWERATDAIPA